MADVPLPGFPVTLGVVTISHSELEGRIRAYGDARAKAEEDTVMALHKQALDGFAARIRELEAERDALRAAKPKEG
jgi:hypothetical protein